MRPLRSTPKGYTSDSDKFCSPADTVAKVKALFDDQGGILEELRRTDTGRLGIPVYLSVCGPKARQYMPTRKQMGKGASPAQAEASGLMELAERYSFFTFWADESRFTLATWSQAQKLWPGRVIPIEEILLSVHDPLAPAKAEAVMDLVAWRFCPAMRVHDGREVMVPLDWFKKLNEFNGASAGNCLEESILQGACELVERHVSALVDRDEPELPTLAIEDRADPVLSELVEAFGRNGVKLWLKDFSLGMPAPTVAALAYDPATFPERSEIVFTAGTAASPVKAAVRALTEVAQLAGDFETGSNYEASGLRKFQNVEETAWLTRGPAVSLDRLPDLEQGDILDELLNLARGLSAKGHTLYTVETTNRELGVAANYSFAPGLAFRERSARASLGLFVGRMLAEESDPGEALAGLDTLREMLPDAPYLPFHQGLLSLRLEDLDSALDLFAQAEPLQQDAEDKGLAAFYQAYSLSRQERWAETLDVLDRAIAHSADVKEYYNLRGVARFKTGDYARAAGDFELALRLDSGSVMDLANLGLCHKRLGNTPLAVEFLSKALELDPDLDFVRTQLEELALGALSPEKA
ncbi:YcaO-like family protein [Fundidesulfovibrio butyratiphilus]